MQPQTSLKDHLHAELISFTLPESSEAMQRMAATKGLEIEYQDPDKGATIYRHMAEDGKKVLKEVVTRIKDGKKVVTQRRPGPPGYGYICDAAGVPPSLYHAELLRRGRHSLHCRGRERCGRGEQPGAWPMVETGSSGHIRRSNLMETRVRQAAYTQECRSHA
jgi:hypothetical protein